MSNSPANSHHAVSAPAQVLCVDEHSSDFAPLADYYREKLAEGGMSPARERLMRSELQRLERAA